MRRLRIIGALAGLMLASVGALRGQSTAIVDFRGDDAFSVSVGDSTALALVGNVYFHHNGAIVTCDSAVRYNANYMECFGNVIINRDSTYVYGDRADFNGITNIAKVYAPIVKTVDGDMTMYSYNMEFNTLTNIGRYTRGGTITQKDNRMESREAIYHADERQVYFSGEVAMRNEEYILKTDSMGYNFDTEVTQFYRPATIWNTDGDFLSADEGEYDRANDIYTFTRNSYILTADDQEIYADSITYMKEDGLAWLFRDIQLHDPAQGSYLFGDYGVYFEASRQAVMTENASAIGYETDVEQPDSSYLRGDTIYMHTIPFEEPFTAETAALLRLPSRAELDSVRLHRLEAAALIPKPDTLPADTMAADSTSVWDHLYGTQADTTLLQYGMQGAPPDSLRLQPPDSLMQAVDSLRLPPPIVAPDSLSVAADSLPKAVEPAAIESAPEESEPEESEPEEPAPTRRELRRERRLDRRREQMRAYAIEEGLIAPDTAAVETADTLAVEVDSLALKPDSVQRDSLQRIVRAHRNVKVFRRDLQAVADSLVAFSIDSTAYLYHDPILWNEENQITADEIVLHSRNEQLDRAEFMGTPIMAQWVMDSLFNQIVGDRIEARFRDNEIREMEVQGNAKSYYYMQEEDKPDQIGGFLDVQSTNLVFRFDSARVEQIVYLIDVKSAQYPMNKIPATHPRRFPGFEWQPERRPASPDDVFDRILRPTRKEESRAIPYPSFRITEGMDHDRELFSRMGAWRDRNDTLRIDPGYFDNLTN